MKTRKQLVSPVYDKLYDLVNIKSYETDSEDEEFYRQMLDRIEVYESLRGNRFELDSREKFKLKKKNG